jgi:hypothetical protein
MLVETDDLAPQPARVELVGAREHGDAERDGPRNRLAPLRQGPT